jgi:hypothetical protein
MQAHVSDTPGDDESSHRHDKKSGFVANLATIALNNDIKTDMKCTHGGYPHHPEAWRNTDGTTSMNITETYHDPCRQVSMSQQASHKPKQKLTSNIDELTHSKIQGCRFCT